MKFKIYALSTSNQQQHYNPYNWLTDIFWLTLVLSCFYTFWLGNYPLFTPDEARYSEVAREMIATGDYITPRVDGVAFLDKPILYYWFQVMAIKLFGLTEWALRFFPALSGIFGCLLVYSCGRLLFDRRTACVSAFILATSPLYFAHAHYANLDLEVAVFISTSLLLFITGMQTKRNYLLYGAYIFAALAFLTKGLIGLAFPTIIIGVWMLLQWHFSILKQMCLISGLLLFIAIIMPWYLLVQSANPEFFHFFFVTQQVTRFLSTAEFNNQSPIWFYIPIILVGFFPWSSFLFRAAKETILRYRDPKHLFLGLWVVIVFIFFSIPHSKIMGYILPLFPPLALITGNYIACKWERIENQQLMFNTIAMQIMAAFLGALLLCTLHFHWLDLPRQAQSYLIFIGLILLASAMSAIYFYQKNEMRSFFYFCLGTASVLLITLLFSATYLNQNTTKPLISYLQQVIRQQDEIVHYYKFYYDVPLYLSRRVTIVNDWQSPNIISKDNWERELWFGMPFQKTDDWLIDENKLWQRFDSPKRLFVFVNNNYLEQFKSRLHANSHTKNYYIVATHGDVTVIANQPLTPLP